MITYNKISQHIAKSGIQVTVEFFDDIKHVMTKNFIFKDQKAIDVDYDSRMLKAVSNVQDKLDESEEPTDYDKIVELKKHFEANTTLTKEDFEKVDSTGKISLEVSK